MQNVYRHGDVGSIRPSDIPADARPKETAKVRNGNEYVLAWGEVTGHAHRLVSPTLRVFEDAEGRLYFRTDGEAFAWKFSMTEDEWKHALIPLVTES